MEISDSTKRKLRILAASTALSAVLQLFPGLVSTPYDEYMADKNLAPDLTEHFHAANIRVYHRYNPLAPFHHAGNSVGHLWKETFAKDKDMESFALAAIGTPIFWGGELISGLWNMIPPTNPLDAWSMAGSGPVTERTVFIRPPGDVSAEKYIKEFLNFDIDHPMTFKSDPQVLRNILFQYIMLHEARHGDQDKYIQTSTNESDADLYAQKVLIARGVDSTALAEATTLIKCARTIVPAIFGDRSHVTGLAIDRGCQTPLDGHTDVTGFYTLHTTLDECVDMNGKLFKDLETSEMAYYYVAKTLLARFAFLENPELEKTATMFVAAMKYIDATTGGKLIDKNLDTSKMDTDYLFKHYTPVPDRLTPAEIAAPKGQSTPAPAIKSSPIKARRPSA